MGGRIGIVDPIVEATINSSFTITNASLDSNPTNQMIRESGMDRDHSFVINLMGWDIMTSNRLPVGAWDDGTTTLPATAVANIFMCIADDNCKPLMAAWRRKPSVKGEHNKDLDRDEFVQRARFGLGAQRVDTIGVIATSGLLYA